MSLVEKELQGETFTSTPRKRKRARAGGHGEDNSLFATGNRTDIQASLLESVTVSRCSGGVQIPVHTHSNTTTTTVSSLFAQNSQKSSQHMVVSVSNQASTQTVFSTCQSTHQGQHVRIIPQGPSVGMFVAIVGRLKII